jgi:hypothetical protein
MNSLLLGLIFFNPDVLVFLIQRIVALPKALAVLYSRLPR